MKKILCADIGGTKTFMGVFTLSGETLSLVKLQNFSTASLPSAEEGLFSFLAGEEADAISVGVAGCVLYGEITSPNLPWKLSPGSFAGLFGSVPVIFTNDVSAAAMGTLELSPECFTVLQRGHPDPHGVHAFIAAGTGLGEGLLVPSGGSFVPLPSEGGHRDYGPSRDIEVEFYLYLKRMFGHVSIERVVSGPGLVRAYEFFVESGRFPRSKRVTGKMRFAEPASVIAEEGECGSDGACAAALELFARAYGAQAGNLALSSLPTGGLFIGGGIIATILPSLMKMGFMESYLAKGRLGSVLEKFPVLAVVEPKAALFGAARIGANFFKRS
ncbi:glucokinase [bacterium]|nr:MAG: glucokinase [bacterium]